MFKSQGQGVNPFVWAVTLPCSEATTVGRRSMDTVAPPSAAFLSQQCGSSILDRPLCCLFPGQGGVLVLLGLVHAAGAAGDVGSGM